MWDDFTAHVRSQVPLRDSSEHGNSRILRFFGAFTCRTSDGLSLPRPLPAKYLNNYQNKVHVATSGNLGLKSHRLEPKAVDDLGSTWPLLLNCKWAGHSLVYFDCKGAEEHCFTVPHRIGWVSGYVYYIIYIIFILIYSSTLGHKHTLFITFHLVGHSFLKSSNSDHKKLWRFSGRPGHPCLWLCPIYTEPVRHRRKKGSNWSPPSIPLRSSRREGKLSVIERPWDQRRQSTWHIFCLRAWGICHVFLYVNVNVHVHYLKKRMSVK